MTADSFEFSHFFRFRSKQNWLHVLTGEAKFFLALNYSCATISISHKPVLAKNFASVESGLYRTWLLTAKEELHANFHPFINFRTSRMHFGYRRKLHLCFSLVTWYSATSVKLRPLYGYAVNLNMKVLSFFYSPRS